MVVRDIIEFFSNRLNRYSIGDFVYSYNSTYKFELVYEVVEFKGDLVGLKLLNIFNTSNIPIPNGLMVYGKVYYGLIDNVSLSKYSVLNPYK